ncbi:MAG: M24 family metallopeptidase, partial [Candidatus Adiutrix sp.]
LKEAYKVVLEAHLTAMDIVRPGVLAKEIDLAARTVIEKAGLGDYFIHRTGHSLGLDIHEAPYIHANSEDVLLEGMVFTIEPGVYFKNLGGIRIEDDVVVTKTGCRSLNTFTKNYDSMILP